MYEGRLVAMGKMKAARRVTTTSARHWSGIAGGHCKLNRTSVVRLFYYQKQANLMQFDAESCTANQPEMYHMIESQES